MTVSLAFLAPDIMKAAVEGRLPPLPLPRQLLHSPAPMRNPYSVTKGQSAIRDLFHARHDRVGNLPLFPSIFPDQLAPIVRVSSDGERAWRWKLISASSATPQSPRPTRCRRAPLARLARGGRGFAPCSRLSALGMISATFHPGSLRTSPCSASITDDMESRLGQ